MAVAAISAAGDGLRTSPRRRRDCQVWLLAGERQCRPDRPGHAARLVPGQRAVGATVGAPRAVSIRERPTVGGTMTSSTAHPVGNGVVLITGGAGFVGTNLALRLLGEGHDVIVLDNV